MEFNGQYLTYEEYKALGGTLDLTPFNILEFEARRKIDEETQERLKNVDEIPFEVKICISQMINTIIKYDETTSQNNGNVASENTNGYSVSYINPTQIKEIISSKNVELEDIIETYLTNVIVNNEHIIYLGV